MDAERDLIASLTQDFARAWQLGLTPDIDEFLARGNGCDGAELTRRLVSIEVAFRRAHGEEISRGDFQSRYPCVGGSVHETIAYPAHANGQNGHAAGSDKESVSRHRAAENLLFGILGWQMDFIERADLVQATRAWTGNKTCSLADLLIADGKLSCDDAGLLWALVNKHVEKHGGSLQRSLSAVSTDPGLQRELADIGDEDISGSLVCLAGEQSGASNATMSYRAAMQPKNPALRYIPLRTHARGGLGEVFVAYDSELGREVALKEIQRRYADDLTSRTRFVLEGEITGGLEHPGIVSVYGLGVYPDGRPYYAMQLIRGESLKQAVERFHQGKFAHYDDWTFELRQFLERFKDVCHTIEYAHSRGVLHRDLKPSNIMLGRYGETLVIDWGLAKPLGKRDSHSSSDEQTLRPSSGHDSPDTMIGSAIGTPAYMSPEQARGRIEEISFASDIFSLGATLYTIVTDKSPYTGKLTEKLEQARTGNFPRPRAVNALVPRPLEAICVKAMALAPEMRYASCRELALDVERWLAGEAVSAYREPLWTRGARWVRRHRSQVIGSALTALLLVSLLATWQWRERRRVRQLEVAVTAVIADAERFIRGSNLPAAQLQLTSACAKLEGESALASLNTSAQTLLEDVERQLAEQSARVAAANRLSHFQKLRDDALFHGTLLPGTDVEDHVAATLQATQDALALFGVAATKEGGPAYDHTYYSLEQQRQIAEQCYELTLLRASALARAPADGTPAAAEKNAIAAITLMENTKGWAPDTRARHLRLAACLELTHRPTEARVEIELAKQQQPTTAMDYFLVGDSLLQQGAFAEAFTTLTEALRLDPRHFWAQYFAAVALLELDRPAEAVAHLTAAESVQSFVWIPILRGYAQGRLENYEAAERDFAAALAQDPLEYGAYLNRGAMRLERGEFDRAIADLQQAIALKPRQYQAHLNLGEAYRRQGRMEEALVFLNQAVELAPHVAKPYRARAQVHLTRDLPAALADFDMALAREAAESPARVEILVERGKILLRQDRTPESLAAFDAALAYDEHHAEAHRLRAEALLALERGAEALPSLTEVVLRSEPSADVLQKRAFERSRRGEFAGAIADYTAALELEPAAPLALARRGWALVNDGYRIALADFDTALKLEPNNGDLYCGRGYARVRLGAYREAIEDAEAAVRSGTSQKTPAAEFALRYNAAAIYAQASARVRFDASAMDAELSATQFQARAIELLTAALAQLPAASRASTADQLLETDEAFAPIRSTPEFQALQRELSSQT